MTQDSLPNDSLLIESLLSDTLYVDSAVAEVQELPEDTSWIRFMPPNRWRSPSGQRTEELLAGPAWPMPPVDAIAGGDLADWLAFHPAYDVDDAPGVGQTRFFTHWGLVDRQGHWNVDGRSASWQRITVPMTPRFDPAILPSYGFSNLHFGEEVILRTDSAWGEKPRFDFTFYQGDYSDSYSEGRFRAHTKRGFGLDLGGTFFSSDGRYFSDNRDKRILSLAMFGPLRKNLFWRARYEQFRDKSLVLPPEPFDNLYPRRDDLLSSFTGGIAGTDDSAVVWQLGARATLGQQRLRSTLYSASIDDGDWQGYASFQVVGWDIDLQAGLQQLDYDSVDAERWYATAAGSRSWRLNDNWAAAIGINLSDWDSDPPSLGATVAVAPHTTRGIRPSLRLCRQRVVPTLLDREHPLSEYSLVDQSQQGFIYSEAGDPSLDDQWNNELSVQWGHDSIVDTARFAWTMAGHAAYIENYTAWTGSRDFDTVLGNPVLHYRYRPRSTDVRSYGAAVGIHGRLFWKIHYLSHYAVKYVTDLDNVKLSGYYPHKGAAMVSLIAPQWKYGVDVRLNAAGLWWYGDARIDPTGYATSHVFRFDLSGSVQVVGDLTLYALLQNVANFPYRTGAGQEFTGRTVRFGLHVTLYD